MKVLYRKSILKIARNVAKIFKDITVIYIMYTYIVKIRYALSMKPREWFKIKYNMSMQRRRYVWIIVGTIM